MRRIGFGAMQLTRLTDAAEVGRLLSRVLELGVNLIDTADVYGPHRSELLIAEALHPYPEDLVVATKGGQARDDAGNARPDCRPEHLRAACEASLQRLRVDTIDLYQLHNPDPEVPVEESLGTLLELRAEGKVREIGISNFFGEQLSTAFSVAPVVSVQNRYNLAQRGPEPPLRACEERGIAFLPWFPLGAGRLANPQGPLETVAAAHRCTPAQVALAWLLERSPAMVPIPGTVSLEHLEQNVAAAGVRLSDDELATLTAWEA